MNTTEYAKKLWPRNELSESEWALFTTDLNRIGASFEQTSAILEDERRSNDFNNPKIARILDRMRAAIRHENRGDNPSERWTVVQTIWYQMRADPSEQNRPRGTSATMPGGMPAPDVVLSMYFDQLRLRHLKTYGHVMPFLPLDFAVMLESHTPLGKEQRAGRVREVFGDTHA